MVGFEGFLKLGSNRVIYQQGVGYETGTCGLFKF